MFVLLAASRRATMYPYGVSMLHATYRCCYSTSSFPSVDVWSVLSSEVCTSDKNEIFIRPPLCVCGYVKQHVFKFER